MTNLINYTLQDGIATLAMDDGKANVMGLPMQAALNAALDRALTDQAVVVLTGRSGMFSGGFDLNVFKTDPAASVRMLEGGARLALRLLAYPHPVLAACNGHAVAMGCFLLLGADLRIGLDTGSVAVGVAPSLSIRAIEVQIGMTLPRFALNLCRYRLTPAHYSLACTTAYPYQPQTALAAGFLDELASPETFAAAVQARAVYLSKLHREAFTASKAKLKQAQLDELEADIQADAAMWSGQRVKQG